MIDRDAFGHAILDYYLNRGQMRRPCEIIEREDGYIDVDILEHYFDEYRKWPSYEKQAIQLAKGRILDIGSGAGRHCLYLQGKSLDVVALDNSPNALEVCQKRGVANTWLSSFEGINGTKGIFDTVLMLGHNFGLLKDRDNGRKILAKLLRITSKRALIIADTGDVRKTDIAEHLAYQEQNRKRGRMPGQIKIRVRYKKYRSPWFDYLQASKEEIVDLVAGTGWEVKKFIDADERTYAVILSKRAYN